MTKHTPGPWTIGRSADNTPLIMVPVHPSEGSGFGVACINRLPRMGSVRGDMDANARLIAAAPDLLAALRVAFPILTRLAEQQRQERGGSMEGPSCNTAEYLAYCHVRAAIAKADGQS